MNNTPPWVEREKMKKTSYFREYRRKQRASQLCKMNGTLGEYLGLLLLEGSTLVRKPTHDLELGDKKIETKTSIPREGLFPTWEFHTNFNQLQNCDYYFLVCLNKNKIPVNLYLIPSSEIISKTIRIGITTIKRFEPYQINKI